VGRVHIIVVSASPEERLAVGDDLDIVGVDMMTAENIPFFVAEIIPDHANRIHLSKEACRQPKVRRRTAKDLFPFTKWRFECIEGHRTNNC